MEKLVRDKIPAIMEQAGKRGKFYYLIEEDKTILIHLLYNKLQEEIEELYKAKNDLELVSEMADVYEVMRNLCKAKGLDVNAFEKYAAIKRQTNGGFDQRIVLEMEDDNE